MGDELSISSLAEDSFAGKINSFLNDSEAEIKNKSLNAEHVYEEEDTDEIMTLKL